MFSSVSVNPLVFFSVQEKKKCSSNYAVFLFFILFSLS